MSYSKKRRLRRILINIYHALNLDKLFMRIGLFDKKIVTSLKKFKGYSDLSDYQLRKDIKTCYYKYLTTPQEYFLFRFFELDDIERAKFLSDNLKVRHLLKTISEEIYVNQLCNKYNFYKLTSNYFKRAVLVIGGVIKVLMFRSLWVLQGDTTICSQNLCPQVLVMVHMW